MRDYEEFIFDKIKKTFYYLDLFLINIFMKKSPNESRLGNEGQETDLRSVDLIAYRHNLFAIERAIEAGLMSREWMDYLVKALGPAANYARDLLNSVEVQNAD